MSDERLGKDRRRSTEFPQESLGGRYVSIDKHRPIDSLFLSISADDENGNSDRNEERNEGKDLSRHGRSEVTSLPVPQIVPNASRIRG